MLTLNFRWMMRGALALMMVSAVAFILAFVPVVQAQEGGDSGDSGESSDLRSPDECAACHPEAYETWKTTVHANTSKRPEFISAWADADRPAYCRQCHGTGYDPTTGDFVFEDVTCQSCHHETSDEPHPTGDMSVDTSSELCGTCHSGVHSPTYEEWLLSDHGKLGIDCITCHEPHDDGMRADNVNELCSRCHAEATGGTHNIEGMECSYCHMYGAQELRGPGQESTGTGHTFKIPPDVCASCHGMTHTETVADLDKTVAALQDSQSEGQPAEAVEETAPDNTELQTRITDLEERARDNLDLGLAGGGLGGLLLGGVMVWIIRREKSE